MTYYLAFDEPWETPLWRTAFLGVFLSLEDAMSAEDADIVVVVEPGGLRIVRERMSFGWSERDELITGVT